MPDEMRKRPVSRRRAATTPAPASTPVAEGGAPVPSSMSSVCGHSGCQRTCNVRYAGPVSHVRDHHAMHAARGVGHMWAASIISGFAVVLTGVIAFQSAQAKTPVVAPTQLTQVMQRLDRLEALMRQTRLACGGEEASLDEDRRVMENGLIPPPSTTRPVTGEGDVGRRRVLPVRPSTSTASESVAQ